MLRPLALLILPSLILASAGSEALAQVDCGSFGETAELVMNARQGGLPKTSTMAAMKRADMGADWEFVATAMIDAAYAEPVHRSAGAQILVARDFKSLMIAKCEEGNSLRAASTVKASTQPKLPLKPYVARDGEEAVNFSGSEGEGAFIITQSASGPYTRKVFCSRPGLPAAVVSDFPDLGIFGQEVIVVPGGTADASSDQDDYEVWHAVCMPTSLGAEPDADIQPLIEKYHESDNQCRGGSGDSPVTMAACDARTVYERAISAAGFCFTHNSWREC